MRISVVRAGHVEEDDQDGAAPDMSKKRVAEADILAGTGDKSWDIAHSEPFPVLKLHDTDLWGQGGERVGGDLGAGFGDGRQEGGLAGVGISDDADIGDDTEFESVIALLAGFAGLGEAGCLETGRGEVAIAETAASTFAKDEALTVGGQVADKLALIIVGPFVGILRTVGFQVDFHGPEAAAGTDDGTAGGGRFEDGLIGILLGRRRGFGSVEFPHESAAGDLDDQVLAGGAVHALAHAPLTAFGDEAGLVELIDEVVEVVIGLEDDVATPAAVPAAGAALGAEGFAEECDGTFAAVTGTRVDLDFVNKHGAKSKRGEACDLASAVIVKCGLVGSGGGGLNGHNIDASLGLFELDLAINEGEEGPIAAGADIATGDELGAALADQDAASRDKFAAERLDAQPTCIAIAPVARTSLTFFMSHSACLGNSTLGSATLEGATSLMH